MQNCHGNIVGIFAKMFSNNSSNIQTKCFASLKLLASKDVSLKSPKQIQYPCNYINYWKLLKSDRVGCFPCVQVLRFPSTSQKHARRCTGYSKLPLNVNVWAYCPVRDTSKVYSRLIPTHTHDQAVTEDEWMNCVSISTLTSRTHFEEP